VKGQTLKTFCKIPSKISAQKGQSMGDGILYETKEQNPLSIAFLIK
jgi:hypothetical protein